MSQTATNTGIPGHQSVELAPEVARRRTFAIISHPDAGKTTLTEKFLLYGGAVRLAGAVRTRKNQRGATSDWMAMEQERGISVTSTALQFDYRGHRINLLDTPGHQDFSEDTYRTLMAVDSAIMVLDSGKGIEPQTRKLFKVCRMRGIPILTFINKLDHPGLEPLELLDEIERVLEIDAVPMNWPIGDGPDFQGVYDLVANQVLRFQRTEHGQHRAPVEVADLDDPGLAAMIGEAPQQRLAEEAALLQGAGTSFDRARFLQGEVTPVFFGSALTNFGVEPFLNAFIDLAPPPSPRTLLEAASDQGEALDPAADFFSGFIFKIQANMNPKHRDCVAFLRVCSGRFEKGMSVFHPRLQRHVRLSRPHRLFAQERETVADAVAGDVIGLINPGLFVIGDTVCAEAGVAFAPMPRFHPEHFAVLRHEDSSKYKQFHKGVLQLEEEGAIQVLRFLDDSRRDPVLAAVGELQFDVVQARLRGEYGVEATVDRLPLTIARWVQGDEQAIRNGAWPTWDHERLRDREGHVVALFSSETQVRFCQERNPELVFKELE